MIGKVAKWNGLTLIYIFYSSSYDIIVLAWTLGKYLISIFDSKSWTKIGNSGSIVQIYNKIISLSFNIGIWNHEGHEPFKYVCWNQQTRYSFATADKLLANPYNRITNKYLVFPEAIDYYFNIEKKHISSTYWLQFNQPQSLLVPFSWRSISQTSFLLIVGFVPRVQTSSRAKRGLLKWRVVFGSDW